MVIINKSFVKRCVESALQKYYRIDVDSLTNALLLMNSSVQRKFLLI